MKVSLSEWVSGSCSDNRQSKIQNGKVRKELRQWNFSAN